MAIETKIPTFGTGKIGTVGGNKLMGYVPFTPKSISNCVAWFDNDINTITYGVNPRISSWENKIVNGNAIQPTSASQPEWDVDGVKFPSTYNSFLDCTLGTSISKNYTVVIIADNNSVVGTVSSASRYLSANSDKIKMGYSQLLANSVYFDAFNNFNTSIRYGVARPYSNEMTVFSSDPTNSRIYKKNTLQQTSSAGTTFDFLTTFRLGFFSVNEHRFVGKIKQLIIYSKTLTQQEIDDLYNFYLAPKFGI